VRKPLAWTDYNIHDLVRLRTNLSPIAVPPYFRVNGTDPNFELALVDRVETPREGEAKRVVGYTAYDLGGGEVVYEAEVPIMVLLGLKSRWRFRLQGLGADRTRIETSAPFLGFQPVRFKVVQLLSRLALLVLTTKLLAKGYGMCHATSVAADDRAHLLFGYSGTGKSSLAGILLDRGYEFLSDDYAIVDAGGIVYCYPDWHRPREVRPSQLSRYVYQPKRYVRPDLKIRAQARVDTVYILERGPDRIEHLDPDEAIRRILLLNMEELSKLWNSPITVMLNHYAYFYPELDFAKLMDAYRATVLSFLGRAERFVGVRSSSPRFEALQGRLERS